MQQCSHRPGCLRLCQFRFVGHHIYLNPITQSKDPATRIMNRMASSEISGCQKPPVQATDPRKTLKIRNSPNRILTKSFEKVKGIRAGRPRMDF
jgi:hypothetical protein